MKKPLLFKTEPHAAQTLSKAELPTSDPPEIGNQLFELRGDGRGIVMTGEELDSLAEQWQRYKKAIKP